MTEINKEDFIKIFTEIKTEPMEGKCPDCHFETLERSRCLFWGPYGGSINCTSCEYRGSVYNYLGRTCLIVEPLESEDR